MGALLRTMIQEEIVPGHGSIYIRTIAPGPGYYGAPGVNTFEEHGVGVFGHKPKSRIDAHIDAQKDLPGPCEYDPSVPLEIKPPLGKFGKGPRLVPSIETAMPTARSYEKPPKYSFGKMKRPF